MGSGGDAAQGGQRFALRAGRQETELPTGDASQLAGGRQQARLDVEIAELAGGVGVAEHAAAD